MAFNLSGEARPQMYRLDKTVNGHSQACGCRYRYCGDFLAGGRGQHTCVCHLELGVGFRSMTRWIDLGSAAPFLRRRLCEKPATSALSPRRN